MFAVSVWLPWDTDNISNRTHGSIVAELNCSVLYCTVLYCTVL